MLTSKNLRLATIVLVTITGPAIAASNTVKSPSSARPQASIELSCSGGKKITISTGTGQGSCSVASNGQSASCGGDGNNFANANCTGGCHDTSGAGTCTSR